MFQEYRYSVDLGKIYKMTVSEQLDKQHWNACEDCYDLAVANCSTMAEVWDKCERGDWLLWLLQKHGRTNKTEIVSVAIVCAEHVLPNFENVHPDDKRPRLEIETAKTYRDNPTEKNRLAAYSIVRKTSYDSSASAAYRAADCAARAAYSAARLAYCAVYSAVDCAVYSAVRLADSVARSAYCAVRSANCAAERKWQADAIKKIVANPFKENQ